MSTSPPSDRRRDEVLKHLESLFTLAQLLTRNAEEAVELVESVYRRVLRSGHDVDGSVEVRHRLFQIMVEYQRMRSPAPSESAAVGIVDDELAELRGRLVDATIEQAFPAAFTALHREHRVLLALCDAEGMTCTDAGAILDLDPTAACSRLEEARLALDRAVFANMTDLQRRLTEGRLPANWRPAALRRMMKTELTSLPPTLSPQIEALVTPEDDVPSKDRRPVPRERRRGRLAGRLAAMLFLITLAGMIGYVFSGMNVREPERNLISLSARQAAAVEATFQTANAEQAERYILDRLGQRLAVPTINFAALQGVSIREIADGIEVPAIVYRDLAGGRSIVVYVYSYAFLDRHGDHVELELDVLRQIETQGYFDLHDLGEEKALIWRHSDDIFVAITAGDVDELRRRISFPS